MTVLISVYSDVTYINVMFGLPAQGLRRVELVVVRLVAIVVVMVVVCFGSTTGLSTLTLLSSLGVSAYYKQQTCHLIEAENDISE